VNRLTEAARGARLAPDTTGREMRSHGPRGSLYPQGRGDARPGRVQRAKTRRAPTVRFITALPPEVTPAQAREQVARALGTLAQGGAP
jgi:hypothetical protein